MGPLLERLRASVGERYRVEHEIGRGGMATVFVAEDLKHRRKVAIKVLEESLSETIGFRRFLQEIEVIARLQHPHLLTLIDSGALDGLPFYVMPYVEAKSLRELIAREQRLPVDRAVAIACEIADGLAYAHGHGVIHRDVKPSNVLMSGGHAIVADFGIATALEKAGAGRITETGVSTGSPTYMSPEQAAGERDLDARTDVYSLACVVYEMLCGAPPVDDASMQKVITRKLTGHYRRVREVRPDVPVALEAAIDKALSTAREDRHATASEFSEAMTRAIAPEPARPGRRRLAVVAAAAVALLAVVAGYRYSRVLDATRELAELNRLTAEAQFASAFELAERIRAVLPDDSTLRALAPRFTDFVRVVTAPAGATVSRQRLGSPESTWEPIGTTPLDSVAIPKLGEDLTYLIRIAAPGYRPVEVLPHLFATWAVWRNVHPMDTLRLDRVDDGNDGMIRIPGWTAADLMHPGGDSVRYGDYHIGRTEVTNAEFKRFVDAGGYQKREYWTEPVVRDGHTIPFEEAKSWLRDRSGEPGPATWSGGTWPDGQAGYPVGGVSYHEAAAYARFAGAQLPTAAHWNRAAAQHQREAGWIYVPASNLNATGPRPAGRGIVNAFGLFDVAGNVREWCVNPIEDGRLTRGAAWADGEFLVGHLIPKPEFDRAPSNGFRIMRTVDADTTLAHLSQRITRTLPNNYADARPVGETEFAIYRRLFSYDSLPLNVSVDDSGRTERYRWEKVSFSSPVPGPRMQAYVFLPTDAEGPVQPILLWGGSGILGQRSLRDNLPGQTDFSSADFIATFYGFLLRSGRAIVLPLIMGSYERDDSAFSIVSHGSGETLRQRDLWIQWIKEFRRTLDYLAVRPDMAADHAGFYGYSWGGQIAPMMLAVEPRFRAAVLNTAGLWPSGNPMPELDMVNYLPRVRTPVLMLNGRHDVVFPYEPSQVPFFRMLGTAAADKKHVVFPTSHTVPAEDNARETTVWFDRYLGSPQGRSRSFAPR